VKPCPTCETVVAASGARWCGACGAQLGDLVSLVAGGGGAGHVRARSARDGPVGAGPLGAVSRSGQPSLRGDTVPTHRQAPETPADPAPGPWWIGPAWGAAVIGLVAIAIVVPEDPGPGDHTVRAATLGDVEVDADDVRAVRSSASGPAAGASTRGAPPAAPAAEGSVALDPGPARWHADLPAPAVDVVLDGELVVAATGASLHAFDLSTGSELWEVPVAGGTVGGLHLVGDLALVVQPETGLVAVDLDDGRTAWARRGIVKGATVADEVVMIADGRHVEALAVEDGRRMWRRELPGFMASGSPGEVVAVVGDDRMTGLDVADGRTRWTLRLQPRGGAHQSADRLVVSSRLGLRVVDVGTGRTLGTAHEEQDLGGRVRGQARVVDGDHIVAAVGDGMVALDEQAVALWRAETGSGAWLLAEPGVVATVESGARVVLLDPETGAGVLRTTPSGWFTALAVGEEQLALAVHTPRRGRLQVHDLHTTD
jgi:hypothetical protein